MILKISQAVYSKPKRYFMMVKQLLAALGLMAMALLWPFHASVASDVYSHRIEQFEANKQAMQNIARALAYDDFEAIFEAGNQIEKWGQAMARYFPEGSNQAPSQALDAIWEQPDDFAKAIDLNIKAAQRLQDIAYDEDSSQLPQAMRDLSASCKACHQSFRY